MLAGRAGVRARAEDLPGLHSFATDREEDGGVVQSLAGHWNTGPVEVRRNHIKMLKRQMFGRAGSRSSMNGYLHRAMADIRRLLSLGVS